MSILARNPPALVQTNGRRLRQKVSTFAMLEGSVRGQMKADKRAAEERDAGYPQKRAKLMLAAKANLHFSDDMPRGNFTLIDPDAMQAAEKVEAEDAGITSRTLVLHPDDLDQAIEQFSAKKHDA